MIICIIYHWKNQSFRRVFTITLYDHQLQTSRGVFVTARKELLYATDATFSVSYELSQPMGKTEFSSTAKNRTKSVS